MSSNLEQQAVSLYLALSIVTIGDVKKEDYRISVKSFKLYIRFFYITQTLETIYKRSFNVMNGVNICLQKVQ